MCAIELLRVNLINFSSMAFNIYMYRGTVYPRITLVIPVTELIVLLIQADEIYNTSYTVTIRYELVPDFDSRSIRFPEIISL